jgi:hypothetical protein
MKLQIRPIRFGLVKIDFWIQPLIIFNPTVETNPTLRISKTKEQQKPGFPVNGILHDAIRLEKIFPFGSLETWAVFSAP